MEEDQKSEFDKDELLRELDLGGSSKSDREVRLEVDSTEFGRSEDRGPSVSDTALILDEWDRQKGEALKEEHGGKEGLRDKTTPEAWADFHAAAFNADPQLAERCKDDRRHQFMKTMMETSDHQALRESTVLNELASELASVQYNVQYVKLIEKDEQRKKTEKKPKTKADKERQEAKAESDLMRAVASACQNAAKDVEDAEDACRGLGMGDGNDGRLDGKKVAEMYKRVRGSAVLKRICQLAGRMRRLAQAKQRQKSVHGQDEMMGVVQDGEVARLLPVELAALAEPTLELDTMRRLVERQTMCRDFRAVERIGKGPIVICVDESGSMQGEPVANAKAFALAMGWIARKQKRWVAYVSYSGGREGVCHIQPPDKVDETQLMDWLCHFYGGGTTMDVPLDRLPNELWTEFMKAGMQRGKTDLIVITDGIVRVPADMERKFNEWKAREQVRMISLIMYGQAGDLARVSDEVHLVRSFGAEEEAIGRCLSV